MILQQLFDFFVPPHCAICGRRLLENEKGSLCTACLCDFPFFDKPYAAGSKLERRFWGQIPVAHVAALFCYRSHNRSTRVILNLKYGHQPELGYQFGRILGLKLAGTDFFDGIDAILPIPLSPFRRLKRGYNQSTYIANGLASVCHLPVQAGWIRRTRHNRSQTKLSGFQRTSNVQNIFSLPHPEKVSGRHVLLVDDVLTTGSTLISCGKALAQAGQVKISIAVLGCTDPYASLTTFP